MNRVPLKLISLKEAENKSGRSRWWIREKSATGEFPAPVPMGGRRISFVEHEIDEWILAQVAKRENAHA